MSEKIIEELAHTIVEAVEEKLMALSPGLVRDAEHLVVTDDGIKYLKYDSHKTSGLTFVPSYVVYDDCFKVFDSHGKAMPRIEGEHPNTMLHGMPYWTLVEYIRDLIKEVAGVD